MTDLVLRPLAGIEEYRACVALQRATWGESFSELVPPSLLMVSQEMGGIASGAFDGERLAGFVFGISGVRDGRTAHWSDMLAVDARYRGRGLGRTLKLHQRDRLLAVGIEWMLWTFDPLVARNAHLNLNRLGATARVYKRDAYGPSDSPLHAGIGTDRLLAEWELGSDRVVARIAGGRREDAGNGQRAGDRFSRAHWLLSGDPGASFPQPGSFDPAEGVDIVKVAVPSDIDALKSADPDLAMAWREATREALQWAFARGYEATGLASEGPQIAAYLLSRRP